MAGDDYDSYGGADKETNDFFAKQAKAEGVPVSRWLAKNGILGATVKSRIKENERSMAVTPGKLLEAADIRAGEDTWFDRVPGGQPVPSILDRGVVKMRVDMPKRRRGRPRKKFARGKSDGD
jgi:hypothetical protein